MVDLDPRFEIMPGTKVTEADLEANAYEAIPGTAIPELALQPAYVPRH